MRAGKKKKKRATKIIARFTEKGKTKFYSF
jgi:hypothetical protein